MNTLESIIEKYRNTNLTKNEFVYVDSYGVTYTSAEAAFKAGRDVKIKKQSDFILEELEQAGINDSKDAKVLISLLNYVMSDIKSSRKRVVYSPEQKEEIIEDWKEAEEAGISKNEFIKEKNVAYTTLLKWIKEHT